MPLRSVSLFQVGFRFVINKDEGQKGGLYDAESGECTPSLNTLLSDENEIRLVKSALQRLAGEIARDKLIATETFNDDFPVSL